MSTTKQHIDDGGTAFPIPEHVETDGVTMLRREGSPGMSLRDWLAGQALEEDIQWHIRFKSNRITREQARYAYADTMIEARKRGSHE
jgi:hypothetical protein